MGLTVLRDLLSILTNSGSANGEFPVVVGLGNPGAEYQRTPHNFGFEVLDLAARELGLSWQKCRFAHALACRTPAGWWMVKPAGYMNRSGLAVSQCVRWFRLKPEQILVVVDDVNLPTGQLRLRWKGSPGGHNGLRDIEAKIKTQSYPRLRGGVGQADGRKDLKDHVLGKFSKDQYEKVEQTLEKAVHVIGLLQSGQREEAMQKANKKP